MTSEPLAASAAMTFADAGDEQWVNDSQQYCPVSNRIAIQLCLKNAFMRFTQSRDLRNDHVNDLDSDERRDEAADAVNEQVAIQ